jgi:hypothetical protein
MTWPRVACGGTQGRAREPCGKAQLIARRVGILVTVVLSAVLDATSFWLFSRL